MAEEVECTKEYNPVVKLKEVEVDTGEKEEDEIYKQRCKLYRYYAPTPEWKERGLGEVRLLQHKESKAVRVLLREEKTLKLRMNHFVHPEVEMKPNQGSDRAWTWACTDYASGEAVEELFAIRFKNSEIAEAFKAAHDKARESNRAGAAAAAAAPAAEAEAAASPADAKAEEQTGTALWTELLDKNIFDPLSEDDIKKLWTQFDKDGNKSIDTKELEALITDLLSAIEARFASPACTKDLRGKIPELIKEVVAALDSNQDGKISWEEFLALNTVKIAM